MKAFASRGASRAFRRVGLALGLLLLTRVAVLADGDSALGNARPEVPRITIEDVSGEWSLTMPAGFKYTIKLLPEGATSVRLTGANNFNGLYQVHFNRLVMKEPVDERLTEFKWLVYKDFGIIVLIEEPPPGKTGAQYAGAILTNRKKLGSTQVEKPPLAPSERRTTTAAETAATPAEKSKQAQSWGTIRGQVVVDGTVAPVEYFVRKGDPIYQPQSLNDQLAKVPRKQIGTQVEDVVDTAVVTDAKTHGLANVFVYLRKRPAAVHPSADRIPEKPVEVVRTKWRYEPRAFFAQTGRAIRVSTNVPETAAIVHFTPVRNDPFHRTLGSVEQREAVVKFDKAESQPIPLVDDIGPNARASCLILNHPYAAITAADGTFEIRDLPVGEHELVVWHERAGWLERKYKAVVRSNEVTQIVPMSVTADKLKP